MAKTTAIAAVVVLVLTGQALLEAGPQAGPMVPTFGSARIQEMVRQAILGAAARLATPECQRVLTDFTDEAGRTLQQNLDRLERQPAEFLVGIRLVDASDTASCIGREIAAYAFPGDHKIFVCGPRFANPRYPFHGPAGEMVMIHEILHALGLGENGPNPTSREITNQVQRRCGG